MGDFSIRFREISDDEFKEFIEKSVLDYSQDLIKSDLSSKENAFEDAKKQFDELLPEGKYTINNYIYTVVSSENEGVGIIWYRKNSESEAFICEFLIFEKFRKKGYGKQTLLLLDNDVKEKGFDKILLHVFRFNKTAFSLYDSLGYKIVKEDGESIYMLKDI